MLCYVTLFRYGVMDNHIYVWKGLKVWENFKYFAEGLSRKYLQNEYLFGKSIITLSQFGIVWSHLGVLVYLFIVKLITLTKAFNFLVLCFFGNLSDHIITSAPPTVVDWMWKPFINRRSFCLAVIISKLC